MSLSINSIASTIAPARENGYAGGEDPAPLIAAGMADEETSYRLDV
jgi:hypothetical protein